ncbi:MAG: glycosyltransferase family 10 [Patescibacteria group bacterium]|nr:glycosyltransferase family 10 [Patescibacteria group bacterium]
MKKIRIKICEFNKRDDELREHFIYKILKKYYDVEFSEKPEYVFFNDSSFQHLKYDGCIKIFYTGENVHPNFNLCDYAVGYDYLNFRDRYYRLPWYLIDVFYHRDELALGIDTDFKETNRFTKQDLLKKTDFCSFVYSNYLAGPARKIFFDKLSNYKKVNAGGRCLNNIGRRVENKLEFETKHKFSVAFENSSNFGYTTEKIVSSLAARTIPIYWGNPEIGKEFNEKRFINCHRYATFDQVVERVKEVDNNDDLYLSIINEPVTVPGYNFAAVRMGFEEFLKHIIDQPFNSAGRRNINPAKAVELEKYEKIVAKYIKRRNAIKKFLARLYRPFKMIKFLEDFKIRYFVKSKTKKSRA